MVQIDKTPEKTTEVDFLGGETTRMSRGRKIYSKVKRRILKHVVWVRIGIIVSALAVLVGVLMIIVKPLQNTNLKFYAHLAKVFLTTPKDKIKSIEGKTNILILGKGGVGHEAPDLTDSIMLASINHETSGITLVSLPRDIWVEDSEAKLNSVYYWGNRKQTGGGLILAKSVIEEIAGVQVDYALVIDFSGFKKIIDVLGGIDVDVQNSFTDPKYPIAGKENDLCDGDPEYKCRYEEIEFEKGKKHMDGETALKFVRSRNALGDEGTDIARAARQQRIIEGIKKKILSRAILLHPNKLFQLKDAVLASIETDMTTEAGTIIARRALKSKMQPNAYVLSEEFLEVAPKSPKYQNLYVFIPKEIDSESSSGRSWNKVHEWFKCVLGGEKNNCSK